MSFACKWCSGILPLAFAVLMVMVLNVPPTPLTLPHSKLPFPLSSSPFSPRFPPAPFFTLPLSFKLSVSDSKLKEFYDSVMEDAKVKARKANVISLTVSYWSAL